MKLTLLVISDTHRNIQNAISLVNKFKPDYLLHLGDVCEDCERLSDIFPGVIILSVIGNNDFSLAYPQYPAERVFTLGGKKFFMCHGHKYRVKLSPMSLVMRARELGADIVLFGHTHEKLLEQTDEMLIMNPGSVRSYGIIELNDGEISARVENYDR